VTQPAVATQCTGKVFFPALEVFRVEVEGEEGEEAVATGWGFVGRPSQSQGIMASPERKASSESESESPAEAHLIMLEVYVYKESLCKILQATGKAAKQRSAFASSRQISKVEISLCKQQAKKQSRDQPLQAADKKAK